MTYIYPMIIFADHHYVYNANTINFSYSNLAILRFFNKSL